VQIIIREISRMIRLSSKIVYLALLLVRRFAAGRE